MKSKIMMNVLSSSVAHEKFSDHRMGRDIKVESFKVDTRVRHLGRQNSELDI